MAVRTRLARFGENVSGDKQSGFALVIGRKYCWERDRMPNSEFDEPFHQVLVENTAQAVFKRLEQLFNARDSYKGRWIWELLQNASDAAKTSGVRVAVHVSDSEVRFAHSGKPFTKKNIGHLIYHGSTKQGDNEATGRFGTGFMTTHLISKRVRVEGVLDDGRKFAFTLSRDGDNPEVVMS